MTEDLKPGTQIAYVPDHAEGDISHKDVEFGFVVRKSPYGASYFCRYWYKGQLGNLRTISCSQLTREIHIVKIDKVLQGVVDSYLEELL